MGILSELALPKGFDAVWGLCTDTITSKIKSAAEQQKINEKLEAYLSRKLHLFRDLVEIEWKIAC